MFNRLRCSIETGTMCPQENDKLYKSRSYGPSRDSKEQCHKMTDSKQITFALQCVGSCRKSLSPSHLNVILPAVNAEDVTPKPPNC